MSELTPGIKEWLSDILGKPFTATKHIHSHQDEVYRLEVEPDNCYLKVSDTLTAERDNLKRLQPFLHVPEVINFHRSGGKDYLLISELPGKNLVELLREWPDLAVVHTFAKAIKQLHSIDATKIFPDAHTNDVLLHGDMALPNILISEHEKIGYIDFGQMAFGSPDIDLADALWSLQRNIGPDYGELFLEQYGPVNRTPAIEKTLNFRYQPEDI